MCVCVCVSVGSEVSYVELYDGPDGKSSGSGYILLLLLLFYYRVVLQRDLGPHSGRGLQ